jgi:hypothetical protein
VQLLLSGTQQVGGTLEDSFEFMIRPHVRSFMISNTGSVLLWAFYCAFKIFSMFAKAKRKLISICVRDSSARFSQDFMCRTLRAGFLCRKFCAVGGRNRRFRQPNPSQPNPTLQLQFLGMMRRMLCRPAQSSHRFLFRRQHLRISQGNSHRGLRIGSEVIEQGRMDRLLAPPL